MELIIASIIAFATTNIDDIFILMLFFGNRSYKKSQVVVGQFLGVGALIIISLIASLAGLLIDTRYIGWLGLLPIFIGLKSLIKVFKKRRQAEQSVPDFDQQKRNAVVTVALVTFANGGDNIGIYVPLFATLSTYQKTIMISIFLVMIGIWCFAGKYLSTHPLLAKRIDKYGHIVTPFVLIILGAYILYESKSFELLN